MRIYTRSHEPDLRHGLVALLLAAYDAEPGECWLFSPWLRDVELPMDDIGHFSSIFGGHRDLVLLSELLGKLASRHTLTLVVKPPDELVPLAELRQLMDVLATRDALVAETDIRDYDATDRAIATLNHQAGTLARQVTMHASTLRMAWELKGAGVNLRFLKNLHAKLLWTEAGALLGSANFTNGGFGKNEELMVEVTTADEHRRLRETARELSGRAIPADLYDLVPNLRRQDVLPVEVFRWMDRLDGTDSSAVADLLRQLGPFMARPHSS